MPGRYDQFLEVGYDNLGRAIEVPVVIIQGAKPGKRALMTAAVHGDELNGIRVLHRLAADIDPAALSGMLILVPGMNPSGMRANSRFFVESAGGTALVDLNRQFPGSTSGGAAMLVAHNLWQRLEAKKADFALDLHTQTRGTLYPLLVYADMRNKAVATMARDLLPDVIKRDQGEAGTFETSLMRVGIPAVTFEIGAPKLFQPELIERALVGVKNVMVRQGMLAGEIVVADKEIITGSRFYTVRARMGGATELMVALMDQVKKGTVIGRQFDPFGYEREVYTAPVSGWVVSVSTDPLRENGATLLRILY